MIPEKESITVEFKSDRGRLSDRELLATVVSLANTEGGEVYLGVEDEGTPTGLHPEHQDITSLAAFIANRTNPSIPVRVELIEIKQIVIAKISVPKTRHLVATSEGLLQKRRLKADGTPEAVPFYPHEFIQRQSSLGLLDYSAAPVSNASIDDFDPLERQRLRQVISRYKGDDFLLSLSKVDRSQAHKRRLSASSTKKQTALIKYVRAHKSCKRARILLANQPRAALPDFKDA